MESIQEYINQYEGVRREWIEEYTRYMKEKHPEVTGVIWFRMPTYKIDCFYLAFSVTRLYFAVHTNDEECFMMLKHGLDKASFGKRSAKIKYSDEGAKHVIYNTMEYFIFKYLGEHTNLEKHESVVEVEKSKVTYLPNFLTDRK